MKKNSICHSYSYVCSLPIHNVYLFLSLFSHVKKPTLSLLENIVFFSNFSKYRDSPLYLYFLKVFFIKYTVFYLHVCIHAAIIDGCEAPCGSWELNSGSLEEQLLLFNFEQFVPPLSYNFDVVLMLWVFFL